MQSTSGRIDGGTGTDASPHWWGTFYYRDNWQEVTILNHSDRDLVIDNIDPINRDVNLHPRVKEYAPGGIARGREVLDRAPGRPDADHDHERPHARSRRTRTVRSC